MIVELTKENLNTILNDSKLREYFLFELKNNPFGKILVYIEDQEVIGYIYYSDIYDRAEINQIEIIETKRNHGIGSKLLQKVIDIVNKDITLEVKETNVPALKLYQKFDFKKVAIRKGYYNGIDGFLMERINNVKKAL